MGKPLVLMPVFPRGPGARPGALPSGSCEPQLGTPVAVGCAGVQQCGHGWWRRGGAIALRVQGGSRGLSVPLTGERLRGSKVVAHVPLLKSGSSGVSTTGNRGDAGTEWDGGLDARSRWRKEQRVPDSRSRDLSLCSPGRVASGDPGDLPGDPWWPCVLWAVGAPGSGLPWVGFQNPLCMEGGGGRIHNFNHCLLTTCP